MTARASVRTSTKKKAKAAPYYWFVGASVRDLVDQLTAAGPDTARLEVRIDKSNHMTFRVVKPSEGEIAVLTHTGDINDSHVCPPQCP